MSAPWRRCLLLFGATIALKCLLALAVPLTTDEAYYRLFGKYVAAGYYDHPPMIGWAMWLALRLGDGILAVRLPAILSSSLVGPLIFLLLRERDEERAFLVSAFYQLSPLNVLFVIVTTDAPLLLFTFLSAFFFLRALAGGRPGAYALSGAFLGLAFLSKYFAVLLLAGYLVHWLSGKGARPRASGMALLLAAFLPALLQNVAWNMTHDWDNLYFNLVARQPELHIHPGTILGNLAGQAYLATPPLLLLFAAHGRALAGRVAGDPLRAAAGSWLVAMAVFGGISCWRTVGLHWALSFYPLLYLLLFLAPEGPALARAVRSVALFTLAHLALLAVLLALPLSAWKAVPFYPDLVFLLRGDAVGRAVEAEGKGYRLAASSYAVASQLAFRLGRYVCVFGPGSAHGRQDDLWMDFRAIDGQDVLVVCKNPPPREQYAPFFREARFGAVAVEGAVFHLVFGRGFRYAPYRDVVLRAIRDRYYAVPGWLPGGEADFAHRYFGPTPPPVPLTLPGPGLRAWGGAP